MNLTKIKEMLGKITPYPWWYNTGTKAIMCRPDNYNIETPAYQVNDPKDGEFIAQAPQIISDLVNRVEGLQESWALSLELDQDKIKDLEKKYQAARNVLFQYVNLLQIVCKIEFNEETLDEKALNKEIDTRIAEEEKRIKDLP